MNAVYATRGLVEGLLDVAGEAEPEAVTVPLATTPAGEFVPDLSPKVPVFTHFYFPEAGGSVSAVFGVDLGVPVGQTQGRFVSHPQGKLELTETDDLHETVFVAVAPWEETSVAAFGRDGRKKSLELVDAEPPEEFVD